ncbi:heterokaryon incompatibility protein [Sporormia fimetaria CBS 119925]|uniref:Heterokaryon incompatibility protein n=1 Tax=Sporormia fimetaria CBS 119925 TaxID=1340428 RepID=A0A6A6V1F8_9PLEO|nr:heterokaryon incompatibility protein [Sporormia fimetaria CBS 119925]
MAANSPTSVRIRLLELAPKRNLKSELSINSNGGYMSAPKNVDSLLGRLFWVPLSAPGSFKALSYSWGDLPSTSPIAINGRTLQITESLEVALRHLQHESEPMLLWVDQICINQQNDDEKTEQVGIMSSIYRAAEEVLLWLGPAADNSDAFMDVWKRIGEECDNWGMIEYYTKEKWSVLQNAFHRVNPEDPVTIEVTDIVRRSIKLFNLQILEAMGAWYQRPWWSRVWVLQECALAKHAVFVCGHKSITAEQQLLARQVLMFGTKDFSWPSDPEEKKRAIALINGHDPSQPFSAARQRRKNRDAGRSSGDTLLQLLSKLFVDARMRSTDPRDTIYGILGLAVDAGKLGIHPDYTSAQTVNVLYTRVAKKIISNGDLSLFSFAQYPKNRKLPTMPSWVPDWTSTLKPTFVEQYSSDYIVLFSASGRDATVEVLATDDIFILRLRGYHVDEVEEVAGIWEGAQGHGIGAQHEQYLNYFAQVRLLCLLSGHKNKPIYPTAERRTEALWRIPVGDLEDDGLYTIRATPEASGAVYPTVLYNMNLIEWVNTYTQDEQNTMLEEFYACERNKAVHRYRSSMRNMKNRRPFMTKDGYVGVGPTYMQPGDEVVVFCGAMIPYVVRRAGEGKWQLIGECYCDGIMDGEIVGIREKTDYYLV